jgi:hypothetical protein
MLSKDKDERYLSSSDMITDLKNLARSLQSNSDAILDHETRTPLNIRQRKQRTIGFLKAWISSIVVTPIRNVRRKRGIERILALRYVFALFVATVTLGLVVTWSPNRLSRPSIYKPSPAALAEYEKGINAIFANDLYKAKEAFDRAIHLDNRFVLAQVRLANVLDDLEQPSASTEVLVKNIETLIGNDNSLSLDEIDGLYFSALAQSLNGDYRLAPRPFRELHTSHPTGLESISILGLHMSAMEIWRGRFQVIKRP